MNRGKLENYIKAKDALTAAKKLEAELRLGITDELLKGKGEGTHTFDVTGFKVKAVQRMNYKVDEDELDLIWEDLDQAEQDLIRFKPSLKLKEYKEMPGTLVLNNAITVTPGMPTLEVKYD